MSALRSSSRPAGVAWVVVLAVAVAVALVGGCRQGPRLPPEPEVSPSLRARGSEGHFQFELQLRPSPPPVGELFEVVTKLTDARTGEPVGGAEVTLDATMPHHGHGMMTAPAHRELEAGSGSYLSRGMKLHMPGRWVFVATARSGDRSDRVELVFEQPPAPGGASSP
jgi:hypothetical protein